MSKITRKSYKRNKLVLGASLFAGVALVSTGFAAWVISTTTKKDVNGSVTVGTVSNQSIVIDVEKANLGDFVFEPESATYIDFSIKPQVNEKPVLSLTIYGKVTTGAESKFSGLNFKMTQDDNKTGLSDAKNKNYIELPDCFSDDGKVLSYTASSTYYADYSAIQGATVDDGIYLTAEDASTYIFKYTVSFKWGSAFKKINPAKYFVDAYEYLSTKKETTDKIISSENDLPNKVGGEGKVSSLEEVVAAANYTLTDLREVIYGKNIDDAPKFTITISADTAEA